YSVTIVDEVGCENTADYQIIEGLEPSIEIVGNNEACSGESIVLTAEYAGGEAVLWSTGQTTQEITVTESGEYCVMTASIDGCQAEACVTITINPRPEVEVEITSGSNPFCVGDSIELTAVSQTATAYAWSNGSTNASIWVTEGATYTVEVTDENGCASSAEMAVGTVESPEITIEGNLMFCAGDSTRLSAIAGKTVDYLWSTGATTEVIWVTEPGEYCVTGTSNYGCETEVCVTVTEFPAPDVYAGEDVNICVGDDVMLTATGGNENTVYTWYLDGELVSVSQSITVSPGVGITEYSVVAINEFCSINSTDHVKVSVYEHPLAGFERDPAGDVPFGSDVNFTDTTMGQVTDWHWDFGDGMTSMLQHPTHNYTSPGSYWVELVAANHGCTDTARAGLEVKVIIDIPNVFTPNNDGVNDMIWLEGTDLELIKMTIFNRWGHSVYASEGRQFGWSGKNSGGEDAEPGTYYYVIEMNYKDGNVSEQTGFFTLIR
ncbi:MAG: gliding motility-associated C-terminal domain-containing protein, partial [Flavobacteriales bacterium]